MQTIFYLSESGEGPRIRVFYTELLRINAKPFRIFCNVNIWPLLINPIISNQARHICGGAIAEI
jgi:hypothetical protein